MKKYSLLAILIVVIMLIVGCSNNVSEQTNADESLTVSFSAINSTESNSEIVTENESSTEISTTEPTTAEKTTRKETTTTQKATQSNTTAVKSTTKAEVKSTTTTTKPAAKETTAPKQTTTKKQTTTTEKSGYWCDEGGTHHSCDVGQIGWVSSYNEASDKAYEYLASHNATGNFRVKECFYCGKFTAIITLD